MSEEEKTTVSTTTSSSDSAEKTKAAIKSLSSIIDPSIIPSTTNPLSLLHNSNIYSHISTLLRNSNSGAGDNNLCRWLYDTFQSNVPDLQLLVLRFLPIISGIYLTRVPNRKPQAGFEAVLLALYAHETTSRGGDPVSITIPDVSQPNVYNNEPKPNAKNNESVHNNKVVVVLSPILEPHGTVRSTRRARIVGVALDLFYSKISKIPIASKVDFCEFCKVWADQDGDMYKNFEDEEEEKEENEEEADDDESSDSSSSSSDDDEKHKAKHKQKQKKKKKQKHKEKEKERSERGRGRVPLPWELLQPILRILGHCLLGPNNKDTLLFEAASEACRCLFSRAMHDVNPKAILPMRSLLRLSKTVASGFDPTDLPKTDVINL